MLLIFVRFKNEVISDYISGNPCCHSDMRAYIKIYIAKYRMSENTEISDIMWNI
jgi:hypothetical protein